MPTPLLTRRTVVLGGAGVAVGLLAGCSDSSSDGEPAPGASKPRVWSGPVDEVSVSTGVGFQGREAMIPVAIAKGFFAELGLKVTTVPGKGTTENLRTLMSGQTTFATLDVSGAIIEKTREGGIRDFWLTSLLHRRNLACFMALADSGISTPQGLAGKRITYVAGGINHVLFNTYATLAKFDPTGVRWVQAGPAEHAKLLAGRKVDAISQFVPAQVAVELGTGKQVTVLPFTAIMGDLHGSAIGVTNQTATEKPDLVRRFNHALLRGLKYTMEEQEEAADIYLAQPEAKTQKRAAVLGEINSLAGYVNLSTPNPSPAPLGHFDDNRLMQNITILQGARRIPAGFTPDQLVKFDLAGDPVI